MPTKAIAPNKLSKSDVISKVADSMGISKAQAEKFVNSFISTVVDLVVDGNDVKFTGFGTFYRAVRAPRDGVNPKTKAKIKIAGYKTAGFKIGKNFKEAVKESKN